MKKIFACTLIALGCMAGTAHANTGEVQFVGAVTDTTCELTPEVGGATNNLISLENATVGNASGKKTDFKLTMDVTKPSCAAIDDARLATIAWSSGKLGTQGLENQSGNATGAWVQIKTVNSEGGPVAITKSNQATDFTGAKLKTEGAKYTAELNGGSAPGTFSSAAAFVVAYK